MSESASSPPAESEAATSSSPADQNSGAGEAFGQATTAWLDAGEQVAEYEAGVRAERRRMLMAVAGVAIALAAIAAALALLG